uniref:Uncharacterized protein n=1 Tax=Acrobeloides nanus TaxID=290746 RepID=A0A914CM03_9BILA
MDTAFISILALFGIIFIASIIMSLCCKSRGSTSSSSNDSNVENDSGQSQNGIKPIECPFCKSLITAPPPYTSQADLTNLSNVNQSNTRS